jgi:hypothetical protein
MDDTHAKILLRCFELDQLTAKIAPFFSVKSLLEWRGVQVQPHEKIGFLPCPYAPHLFLCPLEKRLKCTELVCTDWLRDCKEGEE